MKTLYLIRHAKSSWGDVNLQDYDRPLNNRGKRDVIDMGKRLNERNVQPSLIVASSAKRTRKTAIAIGKEIGYAKDRIELKKELYHCMIFEMLKVVNSFDNKHETAMLVGHNPTTSSFCDYLTGNYHEFPTCAIARIDFEIDSWLEVSKDLGQLVWYDFPKNT